MRKLKAIVVLLIVCMLFTLCACQQAEKGNDTQTTTGDSQTTVAEKPINTDNLPLEKTEKLSILIPHTYVEIKKDMPVMKKILEYTNIDVEWETYQAGQTYNEKLQTRLAVGDDLPDIVYIEGASNVLSVAESGMIAPINSLVEKCCPEYVKFLKENEAFRRNVTLSDGNMYGFASIGAPTNIASNYLMDKRALDKIGMSFPKNIDEFYNVLVKAKAAGYDAPFSTGYKPIHQLATVWGIHLTNYNKAGFWAYDGVVKNDWIDDRLKEFYIYMNKLYKEKLLDQEFDIRTTETQATLAMNNTTMCMTTDTGWALNGWNEMLGATDEPYWYPAPIMEGPHGDKFLISRQLGSFNLFTITKNCKKPEVAATFLAWVQFSDEAYDLYEYGVEGVTYDKKDGMNVLRYAKDKAEYQNSGAAFHLPYNTTIERLSKNDAALPLHKQLFKKFDVDNNDKYYVAPFMSETSLPAEELAEYTEIMNDLTTHFTEYMVKFVKGEVSIDKWDAYLKTANDMGLQRAIEIRQKQYDSLK